MSSHTWHRMKRNLTKHPHMVYLMTDWYCWQEDCADEHQIGVTRATRPRAMSQKCYNPNANPTYRHSPVLSMLWMVSMILGRHSPSS